MQGRVRKVVIILTVILVVAGAFVAASRGRRPGNDIRTQLPPQPPGRSTDIALASDASQISARVGSGATLASILRTHEVTLADMAAIVQRAARVFDLRKVRKDQPYRLERMPDGEVRRFEYEIDADRFLRVTRADGDLVASVLPIPKTRSIEIVRGEITRETPSLVAAMDSAGETIDLTLALADIFGGEIDFNYDLQPGDRFELLVEKQYREPHAMSGYGPIIAAQLVNAGRRVRAVRFTPPGGTPAYFDERGASMRRFFLKSPLKFDPVITSGFSRARLHPVLQEVRAHLGVDYRAPAGAPVVAVADGSVVAAGMSGGSGKMVHLRHSNGYETEYLHLSSISVRAGAHVRQGDVIGRVGATGLATGPHLDYRLKKGGVFVNPVIAHRAMPPSDPIPPQHTAAFLAVCDGAFAQLDPRGGARDARSEALDAGPNRRASRNATAQ
jgi:murein DD-endopeptidase MepM/ murein hydrolase activator NlpD